MNEDVEEAALGNRRKGGKFAQKFCIAGIWGGTRLAFYVNGQFQNEIIGGSYAAVNDRSLTFGACWGWPSYLPFYGSLDDVQLYDNPLSQKEVEYLYSHPGLMIPEPVTMSLLALGSLGLLRSRKRRV